VRGSLASIDIVLPVFNGYEHLIRLLPTISNTNVDYRLIAINDCSTDERISVLLEQEATRDQRIEIIENDENLGFVVSANTGFNLSSERGVVLLNSDVILPQGWLERLIAPFAVDGTIASATPFSNAASIFSFPQISCDNKLPSGVGVDFMDTLFRAEMPEYNTVPTGHGFCMAMSAAAIQSVGHFDQEAFGRGYGEENDWCLRARQAGFRNVIVENLFVYHWNGGSFKDESEELRMGNRRITKERYPGYFAEVKRFISMDPIKKYRDSVMQKLQEALPDSEQVESKE
jgi:GT2 family glycosyltransferase